MIKKRALNRIAKLLDAQSPLNQPGFEDEVRQNILIHGDDPKELDPDMAEDLIRARVWDAAKSRQGDPYETAEGADSYLVAQEAIFASGLQSIREDVFPDLHRTAKNAAKAANHYDAMIYHEIGMQGKSAIFRAAILEAIEDVASVRGDGNRMIALAKLWGLAVYAMGEVPEDWDLTYVCHDEDNC